MSQTLTVWTPPYLSHIHTHVTNYFTERCRTGQGLSSQAHSCSSPTKTTKGSKWPHRRQRKSLQGEEGENLERGQGRDDKLGSFKWPCTSVSSSAPLINCLISNEDRLQTMVSHSPSRLLVSTPFTIWFCSSSYEEMKSISSHLVSGLAYHTLWPKDAARLIMVLHLKSSAHCLPPLLNHYDCHMNRPGHVCWRVRNQHRDLTQPTHPSEGPRDTTAQLRSANPM